jgi:hypothetical protein
MEWINSTLTLLAGIGLRLLIPIALTVAAVYFLRRLDARWQAVARQVPASPKPECWKIKGCPEEKRKTCKGAQATEPCWQAFRHQNGYLKEECLGCDVFHQAPVPIQI